MGEMPSPIHFLQKDNSGDVSVPRPVSPVEGSPCQFLHGFPKDPSVEVDVFSRGCRRHQRHVVERRE